MYYFQIFAKEVLLKIILSLAEQ